MENYKRIIDKLCKEKKIKVTDVSNNWVKILEKDGKTHYIAGYYFDLNPTATGKILDDKYALYDTLKYFNIDVVIHHLLYADYDISEVTKLFHKYNDDVIIKANLGHGGKEVFHINNLDDLFTKMNELFKSNYSISLCPYYNIEKEYRIIIVGDSIELMYYKIKPEVTGDGIKTINELLKDFNFAYFKDKNISDDVLPKGEKYTYNWQFNLSKGASSNLNIDKQKKVILEKITHTIITKFPFKFCSIDIIETRGQFLVLEINSSVSVTKFMYQHEDGFAIAEKIYSKALDLLFEN